MEEDISSIEEQNKSCRTNKISHKSNIRKFFGNGKYIEYIKSRDKFQQFQINHTYIFYSSLA